MIDVGAYVGDSTIAFARRGAAVHALEPSVAFCRFIRRNLEANALASRVVVHEVGLADRAGETAARNDRLHFVEGVAYCLEHLPQAVDMLKLDCEGAEYHLLADPRFLAHLRPREIRMEYHRGPQAIARYLAEAGYTVELDRDSGPVGLLRALRKS
ncbi:MAG: FkbM family methyltransferase [Terriglobales bacterium]